MKNHLLLLSCIAVLVLASCAVAQTKASGTIDCDKSSPMHVIQIPDRADSSISIGQNKCIWTKSFTIEGVDSKEFISAGFNEVMGATIHTTSIGVTHYGNDRVFSRATGALDPKTSTYTGKWTFTSGTGKMRGIKGSGTYTCKGKSTEPGAGYICESEGEYTMPAAKK
jgi:hypothetical protein